MAVRKVSLGSSGTTDALLRQLTEQYGKQAKPKVGRLNQILAPVIGIGSILDAYYDAKFQDKDAGILNVLKNYGQNIGQGFGTLVTRQNYEKDEKMQQLSDIIDRTNPSFKRTAIGKSGLARAAMDIVAGLVTDPLTYVSFGAASLVDDAAKAGVKAAGLGDDVVKKVVGSTLDDATKMIAREYTPAIADAFYVGALAKAGQGAKSGAMKVFGKTVTENEKVVKGAKALVNPLGLAGEGISKATKKVAPEAYYKIKKIFDPVGAFTEMGRTDVANKLLKFQRAEGGAQRQALAELIDSGVYNKYLKLTPKEQARAGKIIEATRYKTPETEALAVVEKSKPEIRKILSEWINKNMGEVGENEFLTQLGDIYPEMKTVDDELINALSTRLGTQNKTVLDTMYGKVDSFIKSGKTEKQAIDSVVNDLSTMLNKKTLKQLGKATTDIAQGQRELWPELLTVGKKVSDREKDFLNSYFDFQRNKSAKLAGEGFETLNELEMGYIARGGNIKGYNENFLKSVLKDRVRPGTVESILSDKKVLKQLGKYGYVKKDTLEGLLKAENKGILSSFEMGELGTLLKGQGATKSRVFDTIKQAEAAGIVYDDNWLKSMFNQTVRQNEQLRAKKFVDELVASVDDNGETLFKPKAEGVFTEAIVIPGVKEGASGAVLYTDKVTKDLTQTILDKFMKPEDLNSVLKYFDKAMSTWKGFVTGLGPRAFTYQARNAFDDTVRMIVGGADPSKLAQNLAIGADVVKFDRLIAEVGIEGALKEMDTSRINKLYEEMGIKAVGGRTPMEDMWRKVIDNGVYSDVAKTSTEAGIPTQILRDTGEKQTNTAKLQQAMTLQGRLTDREQISRIAQFSDEWRKTGSTSAAVNKVKEVLFNYNELTKAEKDIAKRLIPFYSFVKNNIRFYMDTLKNNPERMARFSNVLDGLESGTQGAYGEDWEAMPDWMKESISLPFKKEGDTLSVATNLGLSVENLNDLSLTGMAQNMNPVLKMLVEQATGKNLYYGEDIVDINTAEKYKNYPEALKKLMGIREYQGKTQGGEEYTRRVMSPILKYYLENTPMVSTAMQPITKFSNMLKGGKDLRQGLTKTVIPATIYEQSISGGKSAREKKAQEDLYKLLQKKGIADLYQSYYVPEGLRDQLLK